jgi:diguanylate cyclase (GGDEF)-like protein
MVEAVSSNLLDNLAVGGIVLNLRDVSERLAFEAELTRRASHDGLTGLANPALFRERLAQALRSRRDESRAVSVLFIDLDDFKSVNDSLGHGSGDRVLVAVAERLRQSVRGSETVARLGGDEFGILVQGGGPTPIKLAERVLATLATPIGLDETEVTIQASIGIATAGPNQPGADLVAELLRSADGAMYAAKNAGKGRWSRFEPVVPTAPAAPANRRVRPIPSTVA